MDRKVECVNKDGVSIIFDESKWNPFILMKIEGIYDTEYRHTMPENTMTDGNTYLGGVQAARNIVLYVQDMREESDYVVNRGAIDAVFKEGEGGTLFFTEGNSRAKKTTYVVEKITSDGMYYKRVHEISLICCDPKMYDRYDATVHASEWRRAFTFPHRFPPEKEAFGYKSPERLVTINNRNAADNSGMEIIITGNGTITNPRLTVSETGSFIQIGRDDKPFSLRPSQKLVICTEVGNKHIWLEEDGERTEINQYMTNDSSWIVLPRGISTMGYDARTGAEYISLKIVYKLRYPRA